MVEMFGPATDAAIARYERLRELAPTPDAVFDVLIDHERALQSYAAAEDPNDSGASLDAVRAVIAHLAGAATSTT